MYKIQKVVLPGMMHKCWQAAKPGHGRESCCKSPRAGLWARCARGARDAEGKPMSGWDRLCRNNPSHTNSHGAKVHTAFRHLGNIFLILQSGNEGMITSYSTFIYLFNLFKVVQHYINTTSVKKWKNTSTISVKMKETVLKTIIRFQRRDQH